MNEIMVFISMTNGCKHELGDFLTSAKIRCTVLSLLNAWCAYIGHFGWALIEVFKNSTKQCKINKINEEEEKWEQEIYYLL